MRDPDDRRQARVHLTGQGEAVLRRLSIAPREELRRTGPELARFLLRILPGKAAPRRVVGAITRSDVIEAHERRLHSTTQAEMAIRQVSFRSER